MDILSYLREANAQHGPSGQECEVSRFFAEKFRHLCGSVEIDPLFNVIAVERGTRKESAQPIKIMLCAHQDEIALMVVEILKDGTLRMGSVGGVDSRILPASTVTIHATGAGRPVRKLQGVIGAKPPHLLAEAERKQNYKREDLFVDTGLPAEKVKELVNVGDLITLCGEAVELLNHRVAGKTMDDRACVGIMLDVAERLQGMYHEADVYFVCSSQEEVGGHGAMVAAHTVHPDLALVLDVTHAMIPQSRPDTSVQLDAPAVTYGPFVQHRLLEQLRDTAKKHHVTLNSEHAEGHTWTDTDEVQIAREGVPCVLLELPLKYMHTTVELVDTSTISECARLAAHFVAEVREGWDKDLWN